MQQLSIFDIQPEPVAPPLPPQSTPQNPSNPLDFCYEIPDRYDTGSILEVSDRVLITVSKYDIPKHSPGVVKGFVSGRVLVQRKDGEGLYSRHELHRIN